MTLHGVDIFLNLSELPKLPDKLGPFDLIFIASRGTRVYPVAANTHAGIDWPQCRYFSDETVTDVEIEQLVTQITELGLQWTKCQKLFKLDGENAFSQPY